MANQIYQYPRIPISINALWLHLQVLRLETMAVNTRSTTAPIIAPPEGTEFKLLMPDSFNISIGHNWEEYESVTAKLADTISRYYRATKQLGMGAGGIAEAVKNWSTSNSYESFIRNMGNKITSSENIIWTRIDSPLVYKKSNPVEYNISFDFSSYYNDSQQGISDGKYVNQMINKLMQCSSPKKDDSMITIKSPNIFKITTQNGNQVMEDGPLNLNYAALTTVQPEFKGPYIGGYPRSVSLTLTFTDITPLFDTTFTAGTSVTVTST